MRPPYAISPPALTPDRSTYGGGSPNECPSCGADLEVHQPQPDQPNRLLGTCDECGTWAIFDFNHKTKTSELVSMFPGPPKGGPSGESVEENHDGDNEGSETNLIPGPWN